MTRAVTTIAEPEVQDMSTAFAFGVILAVLLIVFVLLLTRAGRQRASRRSGVHFGGTSGAEIFPTSVGSDDGHHHNHHTHHHGDSGHHGHSGGFDGGHGGGFDGGAGHAGGGSH